MKSPQRVTKRLADVAEVVTGSTPSTSCPEYYGGEIPFVGPSDLGNTGPILTAPKTLTPVGAKQARVLPEGAVLVCCIGATIGKVGIAGRPLATNQQINALAFDERVIWPRYGFYFCMTLEPTIRGLGTSTTLPILPKSRFQELLISFPPLDEQRRIADILDKADAIRRKRKQAIALTDQLLRSTFLEMFGDPVTNPKGWPVRRLGDVSILYSGNSLPPGEEYRGQQNGTLLLKVGDMNLPGNEKAIHVAREWSPSTSGCVIAPAGSIIFPKRGGAISTNKKRYLVREVALDPNLMAVSPSEEISTEFLLGWFDLMDLDTISNGSTVPQLNKKDISPLKVFMPPKNTQQTYSVFCMRMAALNRTLAQSLAESERLFESLVDRAFRGELSRTEHVAGQLSMF